MSLTIERLNFCLNLDNMDSNAVITISDKDYKQTQCWLILEQTPAFNVDYNGHYGNNIFYYLYHSDNHVDIHRKINDIIRGYIR